MRDERAVGSGQWAVGSGQWDSRSECLAPLAPFLGGEGLGVRGDSTSTLIRTSLASTVGGGLPLTPDLA